MKTAINKTKNNNKQGHNKFRKTMIVLAILGLLDYASAKVFGLPDEGLIAGSIFLINPLLGALVHYLLMISVIWVIVAFLFFNKQLFGKQKT